MTKLDEEKEDRKNGSADNDDDGVVDLNDGAAGGGGADGANAKPLSIEEDMERRKKIMRTGEKEELAKVSALLKEK